MATTKPIDRCRLAYASGLRPDDLVWVDEWAEANRVMPPDTPWPGPYRNARTPYLIDIQRTMSPASPWVEGWWQKPVQIGGSVSGENMIATWICAAAGSILVVFPVLDDAKQWELSRFEPLRAGTRELRKRIRPAEEKGADNTKLRKKYPGGVMRLMGANRPIKSATIRYVKFEEPDDYPTDASGQGSVIRQAIARTKNFGPRRKVFGDGTPTLAGQSAICAEAARGDQRHWRLFCPDCQHPQRLVWTQLRWVDGDPATARYACIECGTLNTEEAWKVHNYRPRPRHDMTEAEAAAEGLAHWVPTAAGEPGVASWVGFNALGAALGMRPWPELVVEWLAAQGKEEDLKVFYNNILAEPYAFKLAAGISADALQARAERYELMTCPPGGLICCASVDTQDNRLEVLIRCWGRDEESWGVWYGQLWGDTALPDVWGKLRDLLDTPIKHASGQRMLVDAAFIDAGGHRYEEVLAFCRDAAMRGKQWHAIRGAKDYYAPRLGKPKKVEFNWRGTEVPGGATVRYLGTQVIKNLIDGRLKLQYPAGAQRCGGYYHFPLGFPADYYKSLRAEKREWRRDSKGRKELWWVNSPGNEAWDLEVYNYAAFLFCMQGQHAETVWRAREKLFGAHRQLDLLEAGDGTSQAPATEAAPPPPGEGATEIVDPEEAVAEAARAPVPARHLKPPRPKRSGFVNRWR